MTTPRILLVDDDDKIVFACRRALEQQGWRIDSVGDGRHALEAIVQGAPDLVLMDIAMPEMDGLAVLEQVRKSHAHLPVVLFTGYGTMNTAIRAVQLGAYEYLTKPLDLNQLCSVSRRALETARLRAERDSLREQLSASEDDELIGHDPAMQEVYKTIGAVTTTPNHTPVLILGESGTGKELVARAIHRSGPGAAEPFVAVNCTALPAELLESEFFGYARGAFTGATEAHVGKFEAAGAGTIFLDEIGDMALGLQQKLLRVLQEREFEPLGSNDARRLRARFVLSTHRDLEREVETGRFRRDLFYRISVVPIRLPALRHRGGDLPALVEHLLRRIRRDTGRHIRAVTPEAMAVLEAHDYPGNVRELRNILERAAILSTDDTIGTELLPASLTGVSPGAEPGPGGATDWRTARAQSLQDFERRFVQQALAATSGNVTAAARRSGLGRQSFQKLMKRYGILSSTFRDTAS